MNRDPFLDKLTETFFQNLKSNNPLNNVDTLELLKGIDIFRKTNIKKLSDNELSDLLLRTVTAAIISSSNFSTGTYLYRIRKQDTMLLDESDIWAPPEEFCSMGRLNLRKQSMLYTSLDAVSPAYEMKLTEGDTFTLIQYKIKDTQNIQATRIALHDEDMDRAMREMNLSEKGVINARIINQFLFNEFTRDVGVGTEFLYRISNRLAIDFFDIPNCDGYLYPSVASKQGYNLALKPEAAIRSLELNCLFFAKLAAYEGDNVVYKFIKKANKIDGNRRLVYDENFK